MYDLGNQFKINQNITIKSILSIENYSKLQKEKNFDWKIWKREKKRTKKQIFSLFLKMCYSKNTKIKF